MQRVRVALQQRALHRCHQALRRPLQLLRPFGWIRLRYLSLLNNPISPNEQWHFNLKRLKLVHGKSEIQPREEHKWWIILAILQRSRIDVQNNYDGDFFPNSDCEDGKIRCGNETSCIDAKKRCDGNVDCWDASDESNCSIRNQIVSNHIQEPLKIVLLDVVNSFISLFLLQDSGTIRLPYVVT